MQTIVGTEQVRRLISHVEIAEDLSGFSWFDQPRAALPVSAFSKTDRRASLIKLLTECLYECFYCTGEAKRGVIRANEAMRGHNADFVQSVLSQNGTQLAWTTLPVLKTHSSHVVSAYGRSAVYTDTRSPLLRGLQPGDAAAPSSRVAVGGRSWSLTASPGYILFRGEREPQPGARIDRLYWTVGSSGAPLFIRELTRHLNAERVGFRAKVLAEPSDYSARLDTAVVYLSLEDGRALRAIQRVYAAVRSRLRPQQPSLTRMLAPGLAFAEDPRHGLSFGQHRCGLLAEGLVRARSQDISQGEDMLTTIGEVFAESGIALELPHKLMATDDCYVSELKVLLEHAGGSRAVVASAPQTAAPPSNNWFAVACAIATRLEAEAFRDGGQAQWLGGDTVRGAERTAFCTLGDSLYKGTAGVGLFLAEVAQRTGNHLTLETALGALTHALCVASRKQAHGLYIGSVGVAVAALRGSRLLRCAALEEKACAFARTLLPVPPEVSPDLLYGVAGQIVGMLVLSRLLDDNSFRERAFALGEHLLAAAQHASAGLSWPNQTIEASQNLTGYSHGAAGIAMAFGFLWRDTCDRRFASAAKAAVAYEDAVFSHQLSNWPDFRQHPGQGHPYLSFWCHGAPGILASRVKLHKLLPPEESIALPTSAVQRFQQLMEADSECAVSDFSLCHGMAGNAELLDFIAAAGPELMPDVRSQALSTALRCWQHGVTTFNASNHWACGKVSDSPSLFLGRAGIGYAYLRLHDPRVPSVLLMDPEEWQCLA